MITINNQMTSATCTLTQMFCVLVYSMKSEVGKASKSVAEVAYTDAETRNARYLCCTYAEKLKRFDCSQHPTIETQ
jgi:hypothetical protein